MASPLLDIRGLHLTLKSFDGEAHVLNGVDLTVRRGEMWGLVGETGCGKSVTGLSVFAAPAVAAGPLPRGRNPLRRPGCADAAGGENAGATGEPDRHDLPGPDDQPQPGLPHRRAACRRGARGGPFQPGDPRARRRRFFRARRRRRGGWRPRCSARSGFRNLWSGSTPIPIQFSGGMRQRCSSPWPWSVAPTCSSPTSPRRRSTPRCRSRCCRSYHRMVPEFGMGLLLITHNLAMVAESCTHVAVMYAGSIVEQGPVRSVLRRPSHPYTRALLAAIPTPSVARGALQGLAEWCPTSSTRRRAAASRHAAAGHRGLPHREPPIVTVRG